MTRIVAVLGLLTVLAVAGCAADGDGGDGGDIAQAAADATTSWREHGPSSYTYALTSSCGERALHGTFRVTVVDAAVTQVEPLDEAATDTLTWVPNAGTYVPTVTELLQRIADEAGTVAQARFDDTGLPTHVLFDPMPDAIDDEECYDLADLEPAG